MENLFEQMTNITKAHGYDILSKQVGELKSEKDALEAQVKELKEALITIKSVLSDWNDTGKYSNLINHAGNAINK